MKTNSPPYKTKLVLTVLGLLALGVLSARADLFDYFARSANVYANYANYSDTSTSWGNSSDSTTLSTTQTARSGCRYYGPTSGGATSAGFTVKCTGDASDPNPSTWRLWCAAPNASHSGNIVVSITASPGVTLDPNLPLIGGLPTTPYAANPALPCGYSAWARTGTGFTNNTDKSKAQLVCSFTLAANTPNPALTFRYVSGTISGSSRWYSDFYRFEKVTPCSDVCPVTVAYPFKAGDTQVTVSGVTAGATKITIYTNGVEAASKTTGIVAGNNDVPLVSPLVKGQYVLATQTLGGQESCNNLAGQLVGTFNPAIKVALNLRNTHTTYYTGPIGAGGGVGTAYTATDWYGYFAIPNTQGGYLPPAGGTTVSPSTCWQTVTIDPNTASYANYWFTTGSGNPGANTPVTKMPWCAIDGLFLEPTDDTDVGPFQIYIANLANGSTFIHDWNGEHFYDTAGTYLSSAPIPGVQSLLASVTTSSTSVGLQTPPPGSTVTACSTNASFPNQAITGTNSQFIYFAWNNAAAGKFLRLVADANGVANWVSYPQVDMTKPISFDILLLPGSASGAASAVGAISFMDPQTLCPGSAFNLSVTAKGPGDPANYGQSLPRTFTYQWKRNGSNIASASGTAFVGPTDPPATIAFSKAQVFSPDAGTYSVAINDGTCTLTRQMILTVPLAVQIDYQPSDTLLALGQSGGISVSASVPGFCPCGNTPALTYQWYHGSTAVPGATDTAYNIAAAAYSDYGPYHCVISNTCSLQTVTSGIAKIYVLDPAPPVYGPCYPNNNVLGLYFTNHLAANPFVGSPTWTNLDSSIQFDWAASGPAFDIYAPTDTFTVRWVATLQAPYDQQHYTFYTTSDDGVRLWVNGQLLIDKWVNQSKTTWSSAPLLLTTNVPYDIVMEYYENAGSAVAQLGWESESVQSNLVASTAFCAADPDTGIPPLTTLTSPANNATDTLPTPVTLTAAVTAESATVNKVEFYNYGTNLLNTVTGPYTIGWTPPAAGTYSITARTYYNTTHTLNTPANKLTVNPSPQAPVTNVVVAVANGNLNITYSGGAASQFVLLGTNQLYSPYSAVDLGNWAVIATTNGTTPATFSIPQDNTPGAKMFYRVKSQ